MVLGTRICRFESYPSLQYARVAQLEEARKIVILIRLVYVEVKTQWSAAAREFKSHLRQLKSG